MTSRGFTHHARTLADPATVTDLLDDVDSWSTWSRPLLSQTAWERWGSPAPGGVGAVRRLGLWPIYIREQITSHERGSHQEYTVLSPHLFRDYRGRVTVFSPGGTGTLITWHVEFTTRFATFGAPTHRVLSRVIERLAARLAHAADNTASTVQAQSVDSAHLREMSS
jgi:hypothetical protein